MECNPQHNDIFCTCSFLKKVMPPWFFKLFPLKTSVPIQPKQVPLPRACLITQHCFCYLFYVKNNPLIVPNATCAACSEPLCSPKLQDKGLHPQELRASLCPPPACWDLLLLLLLLLLLIAMINTDVCSRNTHLKQSNGWNYLLPSLQ